MRSMPLLALDFISPWMLAGLAVAGVPIIIHLLHKRRYRETPWAAMRFLMEAARKNTRRLRLEQLMLLIIRTLILVLLVLAMSRPVVETLGGALQADVPTHRILVVDATFSMGFQPAEFSRFDRAKQTAREIVDDARQGDALNLVRIAGSSPWAVVRRPSFQKDQVRTEIDQLPLSHEAGDLPAALDTVLEILGEAEEVSRKEVYIISDLQRADWLPTAGDLRAELRGRFERITKQAGLMLIDVGQPRTPNAAVTRVWAEESLATVDRPLTLRATVHNFGDQPLSAQLVQLFVDDRVVDTARVDLPAHTEQDVEFTRTFAAAGECRLEVRLEADPLALDDRRWLALPVKEELSVLLVNGKQSGRLMGRATDHLQLALSPELHLAEGRGLIRPRVVGEGELLGTDLSEYDCVFLCNVRLLTDEEVKLLEAYLEGGGSLVVSLGDQVQADHYNQVLFREGKGPLSARLGDTRGSLAEEEYFEFDDADLRHPILAVFRGNPNTGLASTRTYRYVQARVPADSSAQVALSFSSGDPAIITGTFGQGRVVLITTSLDRDWGTWVVLPTFPPVMHELVHFAASGRWEGRQLTVGQPLVRTFSARAFDAEVILTRPDETQQTLSLVESPTTAQLSYGSTALSGIYELSVGPPLGRRELFAFNVDPQEGDLDKVGEEELQSELLTGLDYKHATRWTGLRRTTETSVAERGGVWRWLLVAGFLLLLVEQLMAWNFAYGFLLLYALVAFAFARQVFVVNGLFGVLLAAAFAAGFAWLWPRARRWA